MKEGQLKILIVLLLVLTVITGLFNLYLRKYIPGSYSIQLSYNQLYLDPSVVRLKTATHQNRDLKIELAGAVDGLSTNIKKDNIVNKNNFVFSPADTGKIFWIKATNQPDSLLFSIHYSGDEVYRLASNSGKSNYEIRSTTLNYSETKLYSHHYWAYDFADFGSGVDSVDVMKYIHDTIGILGPESSLEKIEKIFAHVMPLVTSNLGIPADSVTHMPVLKLLDCLKKNQVKVWCGNLTEILGFLATRSGLPCRMITTEGYEDFSFAVHSFNEIYVPEEKKWVYSDLTTGIAYASVNDRPVNIIDISRLLRIGIKNGSVKTVCYTDSLRKIDFDTMPAVVNTYFNVPQKFRYYYPKYLRYRNQPSLATKIKKFFDPDLNYAFYNEDNHYSSNSYLWRQISIYLLFALILLDIILVFILFRKRSGRIHRG